jgi:hypothetical protein
MGATRHPRSWPTRQGPRCRATRRATTRRATTRRATTRRCRTSSHPPGTATIRFLRAARSTAMPIRLMTILGRRRFIWAIRPGSQCSLHTRIHHRRHKRPWPCPPAHSKRVLPWRQVTSMIHVWTGVVDRKMAHRTPLSSGLRAQRIMAHWTPLSSYFARASVLNAMSPCLVMCVLFRCCCLHE